MHRYLLICLISACFCLQVSAQEETNPTFRAFDKSVPAKANKELQFFAYFYTQGATSNWYPANDFLKGQIVGRLFGTNTTGTSDSVRAYYAEQRLLPFFVYSPRIFDNKVTLRASFEIDWTWGDAAYGAGGNFGSGISADQVNLQTQNVEMEYVPKKHWTINLGLQRMYDTPHDPYRTIFEKFTTTGYRLAYWGTDGVGVSVRRETDYTKLKGGMYKLYENNVELNDDVTLFELSAQQNLGLKWNLGASLYHLRDRSNGKGGVSILGQGLASPLTGYNGTFRFPLGTNPYRADVSWLGAFFSRNEDGMIDPWILTGFANFNLGKVDQRPETGVTWRNTAKIRGLGANLRAGYRYGQTMGDLLSVDVLYTSGDANGITDGVYSGVMTGNTWGSPAGIFIGSGAYILFPHGNVVNRFVSAVNDISNTGFGVTGGTINLSRDFIPNKLHTKIGFAGALSPVTPVGGGNLIGLEGNAKIGYDLGAYLTIEGHAAYMALGDFYDSPLVNGGATQRPVNPWVGFVCVKWLIF